ncbi:MAG: DUF4290 domain-containing protein [Bacteroidales bacterium]|nr:DUF4290 domain-containing protein [Bacteroidales bacterium]
MEERKLDYNTERERMSMPEYGRNVLNMVESLRGIEDRQKRNEQAKAIVRVMEILNPQVHSVEDWEHKLWDHLFAIAGYDLDVDSPYPIPSKEDRQVPPMRIPLRTKAIKATHYGRNIESIIDLIASEPEGELKNTMLRRLAFYMRQQYLIWNKDSVEDSTIFHDIEVLSGERIKVPEGLSISRLPQDGNYNRPGLNMSEFRKPFMRKPMFRKNKRR